MRPRGSRTRRTRRLAVTVVLTTVVAGGLSGCSTTSASSPTPTAGRSSPPVTRDTRPLVTLSQLPLVDHSRPVVSDGVVVDNQRDLPTTVWTPSGKGPFPLVVFVHGYDKGPLDYRRFCAALASAGYVVAAPSFPQEDPARGFALDRAHLSDEAADVAFVITAIDRHHLPRVDGARLGVVGHSDGADAALLVGYGAGTVDPRVDAVVADAPDPMPVAAVPSPVPLLLVQGTSDSVVPFSASEAVFDQVDAPVSYVTLIGADHLPPIIGGSPWTPVLDDAVAHFLDATVAHRGPGIGSLPALLARSPLVRFESKG